MWDTALAYWRAGGGLLILLAMVSMGILALMHRCLRGLGQAQRESDALGTAIEEGSLLVDALYEIEPGGPVCQLYQEGLRQARETGSGILAELEHREESGLHWVRRDLILLIAFTASAPLIGLLGTVLGMVETFDSVAATSAAGDTGQKVAGGIRSALITTQYGLMVALPGVFGCAWVRKRIQETTASLGRCRFLILEALKMNPS
jgi:biopolymer transport protein ExbB